MLLNLIKYRRPDIAKIYLYVKDLFESRYQSLIKGQEKVKIKQAKNQKALIDYSQTTDGVYENLKDYNPKKNRKLLIVFKDMIADMESNKKLSPIVTDLFQEEESLTFYYYCYYFDCFYIKILFSSA